MGSQRNNQCLAIIIFVTIVFGSCSQQISAARPLGGEQWLEKILGNIQSLPRGPIPPSAGSPCTHIPGNGSGKCRLGQMNFAGHIVAHAPPAFPGAIINSDAASVTI